MDGTDWQLATSGFSRFLGAGRRLGLARMLLKEGMALGRAMVCLLGLVGAACGGMSGHGGDAVAGNGSSMPSDRGIAGGASQQDEPVVTTKVLGLQQLAASDGTLIAIAEAGTVQFAGDEFRGSEDEKAVIYASVAGAAWSEVLSESGMHFHSVAAGNGHFAALGRRDAEELPAFLYVSEDAQMWMDVALPSRRIDALVFGNGTFVATETVGAQTDRHVYVSSDARTWELAGDFGFKTLGFGAGVFVGTNDRSVSVSKDGRNWEPVSYEWNPIEQVAVVADTFVAVTYYDCCVGERGYTYHLVTSRDGLSWTQQALEEGASFPVWSPAGCVGVRNSTANLYLASGASCASADYSLSSAGSMILVEGRAYAIHRDDRLATSIVTSTDALNWTTLLK